ncbi:MAG: nicotinamide-nucleotide amidohydrolase family protein [Gammaproteobacteria bacterium]|jgi:nicotinamide-nucleotide amidase|nr:nicotinamide-nucleotide amidohydrolase family protein [Gammaproteobacteria bacterium]MBT3489683.1 nicotinamide-nucleotide amidohydrolase family protein [Gammaproteobacteria bacterium]MBT3717741.1 nicotinamide-nucleotide amidohydrolase family protein [Gammaproteobacteria bacterium]MBT3845094.1 nicotinamide-nucleotide amidohydrolase family protein [Gammaproteobacteria bacterium]MBT3894022.1 nicotinamide-nucleotide amidohydrolase family protein [Gammaproteobacteria bacterium]
MGIESDIEKAAQQLSLQLMEKRWRVAAAESCTAGWIAKSLTDPAGSTAWFERGFVTYSNEAKVEMLGVKPQTLSDFGAVSEETVREMVAGALENSRSEFAVAVSGIAGPSGGSAEKPVGLVWFGWQHREGICHLQQQIFNGDRDAVRGQTVVVALQGLSRLVCEITRMTEAP